MHVNMGQRLTISSDFMYVSNFLTLSSFICIDKQNGGFKILSQNFSKMLVISRYWAYRHTSTLFLCATFNELCEYVKLIFVVLNVCLNKTTH